MELDTATLDETFRVFTLCVVFGDTTLGSGSEVGMSTFGGRGGGCGGISCPGGHESAYGGGGFKLRVGNASNGETGKFAGVGEGVVRGWVEVLADFLAAFLALGLREGFA